MRNTNDKGIIAEQRVILSCVEKGYTVSKPISPSRYDLIVDDGKKLNRVQVKYGDGKTHGGANKEKAVSVQLRSYCHGKYKTYDSKEVDLILVYIPRTDKIVCLKPEVFSGKCSVALRFEPPKNKQKDCHFVDDLEW